MQEGDTYGETEEKGDNSLCTDCSAVRCNESAYAVSAEDLGPAQQFAGCGKNGVGRAVTGL